MDGEKQQRKQLPKWLEGYKWKPGQSGNPNGRPPGKTLKEWAREFLMELPDEMKLEFLREMPAEIVFKMAEGNPANNTDITSGGEPIFQISREIAEKNGITSESKDNSEGQS